jgi:hypothetical protein
MSDEKFNPAAFMRQLKARGGGTSDYLDVKWRLVWLRSEHPEARIETELREGGVESNYAVFKASVTIPDGGSATGWGSETKADFGDFLEKAETKALGRALIALGYGAADATADEALDSAPIAARTPPAPARNDRRAEPATARPVPAKVAPTPIRAPEPEPPIEAENDPPIVLRDDDTLLDAIRNDFETPETRWDALWDYYSKARDVAELNGRAERVKTSGMPTRELKAAYRQKHTALAAQLAPASIAG